LSFNSLTICTRFLFLRGPCNNFVI